MTSPRIVEILNKQPAVTDVAIYEEVRESEDILRFNGFLNVSNLMSKFIYRETPIMDINTIGLVFEYTLIKKEKKEAVYEVIDFFNRTKTGLKATLATFSKGIRLGVLFTVETVVPHKSEALSSLLSLIIPILSAAPVLFSNDLSERKLNHKSISGK